MHFCALTCSIIGGIVFFSVPVTENKELLCRENKTQKFYVFVEQYNSFCLFIMIAFCVNSSILRHTDEFCWSLGCGNGQFELLFGYRNLYFKTALMVDVSMHLQARLNIVR